MNEVTKIHLGRQAFTIAADAHHKLKNYIDAVKKEVGDQEVVDEVEIRMAELLTGRGISDTKVILLKDVEFIKEQLGSPKDFKDEENEAQDSELATSEYSVSKRLFRDTDNAMLAGVAAGLAQYFGLDTLLIRILFVILVLVTFGWGILLYILLWLLVPEAKTPSDRLQMAGEPVNIGSLKGAVERADIKGAARRANNSLAAPINRIFKICLKIAGLVMILAGLSMIFGLIAWLVYALLHSGTLSQGNVFPIGTKDYFLMYLGMADAALVAIFIILFGLAIFRRAWPLKSWITGTLIGLTFIGFAAGGALAADVLPQVRDRYNANLHTTSRSLGTFTTVNEFGKDIDVQYQQSSKYEVVFSYYGNPDLSAIKTKVANNTLTIDASSFSNRRVCQAICIPPTYQVVATVYSPNFPQFPTQPYFWKPGPYSPFRMHM